MKSFLKKYFKALSRRAVQTRFLLSIMGFCVTLLGIIFGLNSITLEDFLHPDTTENYSFLDFRNIAEFPIDQYRFLSGLEIPLEQPNGENIVTAHEFLILDTSRSIDTISGSSKINNLLIQSLGTLDKDDLNHYSTRPLLAGALLNMTRVNVSSNINMNLFYLVEENNTNRQALTDGPKFTPGEVDIDLIEAFSKKIKDKKETNTGKSRTQSNFGLLINELKVKIEKLTKEGDLVQITIISDFDDEGDELEFFKAVNDLNNTSRLVKYKLLRMPASKDAEMTTIDNFLNQWFNTCNVQILDIKSLAALSKDDKKRMELMLIPMKETNYSNHKEVINLIYPATNVNGNYDYGNATASFTLPEGSYLLSLKTQTNKGYKAPSKVKLRINKSTPLLLRNGQHIPFQGGQFSLSSNDVSRFGQVGFLEVLDIETQFKNEYSLWLNRRLNKTGIGWYIILLNCFLFSSYLFAVILIRCLFRFSRNGTNIQIAVANNSPKSIIQFKLNTTNFIILFQILRRFSIIVFYIVLPHFWEGSYLHESYNVPFIKVHLWVSHIVIGFVFFMIELNETMNHEDSLIEQKTGKYHQSQATETPNSVGFQS